MRLSFSALAALVLLSGSVALPAASAQSASRERRRTPVVEVFQKSRDAVVNISTTRVVRVRSLARGSIFDDIFDFGRPRSIQRKISSVGSGVVVHESGFIITNAHVVAQTSDIQVIFADGSELPAETIAVDAQHDLAVLRVEAPEPLPHIRLGRSDDLMIGETVVAIGNPLGLQHTVTRGIISALDRELTFSEELRYTGLIQTDAAINPGNSGGPLLNINAELIGINTAIRGDAQNVGFAIPVDQVWELLPMMLDLERRERVTLGLTVAGPDATVSMIRPDTPAARADLEVGDRIEQLNGAPIRDSIDYYVHLLPREAGEQLQLTVRRDGRQRNASLTLERKPLPDGRELAWEKLGFELLEIPSDLRREYDLPDYVRLVVDRVDRNSPAARAGIRRGDAIIRINRAAAGSLEEVGLALEEVAAGEPVLVEGLRLSSRAPFFWHVQLPTRSAG